MYVKYGEVKYNEAIKALIAYRKVKAFHNKWIALKKAADNASLGLSRYGVEVIVKLSEAGWRDFMLQLSNEVVGKLKGKIESTIQDHAKSKMSDKAQLRFDKAMAYLDRIGMLNMIWKGVKAKELAKKNNDHPDVFDYKLRFFIGLLAKGEGFLKLYKKYWMYDEAYWPLLEYAALEKELRSGLKRATHPSWRARNKASYPVFFAADNGLNP